MMREITLQCRAATIFDRTGGIDEDGFRQYLQKFIDLKIDVYLASAGSGEGHALAWPDLRRVYQIGVSECRGKIEVNANPPEHNTARGTIEQSLLAIECGMEIVNIYQPGAWHGYRPIGNELRSYYDTVLKELNHPVALAPNPIIGQGPSPALVADLCHRYPQIVSVNLVGQAEPYFLELQALLKRDVRLFVDTRGIPNTLALGAAGLVGGNLNILPQTYRSYADCYRRGDVAGMAALFGHMIRTNEYTKKWSNPNSRMIKMFLAAFRLPGWEGGVREPCLMPDEAEITAFGEGLLALGVPEFSALRR
jgi:dihydrodipicolinate synthase/N-acetylneuraminate lyase